MVNRRTRRLLDFERNVDADRLEAERRQFWKDIADADPRPLYRSTTANLIAAGPTADGSILRATCRELLASHPSRVFLLLLSRARHPLQISLGARLLESEYSQTVLIEEIAMRVGRQDRPRLPSLILPMLDGDVPSVTFWSAEVPRERGVVEDLAGLGDELVFDSALLHNPRSDAEILRGMNADARDLSWVRLRPWRRTLAEAFEHLGHQPGGPVDVTLEHGGGHASHAACSLLADWLERRVDAHTLIRETRSCAPTFEPLKLEMVTATGTISIRHAWPEPRLEIVVEQHRGPVEEFATVSHTRTRGEALVEAIEAARAPISAPS